MTLAPVLMSNDPTLVGVLADAPAHAQPAAVVVDWERPERRAAPGAVTSAQLGILEQVRTASPWPVICRINSLHADTEAEVRHALELGCAEILVPMVRRAEDVHAVQRIVRDRCPVGAMIETRDAVADAARIGRSGISRAFIRLLDLALERRSPTIFTAVVDGTVTAVTAALGSVPYGFGGLTDPDRGHPVSARLLMSELVRQRCAFSFLRNSFLADASRSSPARVLGAVRSTLAELERRSPALTARDHREFVALIGQLDATVNQP